MKLCLECAWYMSETCFATYLKCCSKHVRNRLILFESVLVIRCWDRFWNGFEIYCYMFDCVLKWFDTLWRFDLKIAQTYWNISRLICQSGWNLLELFETWLKTFEIVCSCLRLYVTSYDCLILFATCCDVLFLRFIIYCK